MHWDVFCRVIDNWGDIGVCWRLGADLAARGETVRLWVDDASALAWMAPRGAAGVRVHRWQDAEAQPPAPGDVVVEAFGCDPPAAFVAGMAARQPPPVWINLEYLSAEPYVARSHGLPSPQQAGPGRGLTKWFFYPGFTAGTGGLLREPGLLQAQQRVEPARGGERQVLLFCYDNPLLPALLQRLADEPTRLLVAAGAATEQMRRPAQEAALAPALRWEPLPLLPQPEFDRVLWSSDLNFVRGEDSLVRAIWAGRPFVWQLYPQADGAHAAKLEAFLAALLEGAPPILAGTIGRLFRAWNGLGDTTLPALPRALLNDWAALVQAWRERLLARPDLVSALAAFARARRPGHAHGNIAGGAPG